MELTTKWYSVKSHGTELEQKSTDDGFLSVTRIQRQVQHCQRRTRPTVHWRNSKLVIISATNKRSIAKRHGRRTYKSAWSRYYMPTAVYHAFVLYPCVFTLEHLQDINTVLPCCPVHFLYLLHVMTANANNRLRPMNCDLSVDVTCADLEARYWIHTVYE